MSAIDLSDPSEIARRERQIGMAVRIAELGMSLIEDTVARAKEADLEDRTTPNHKLTFVRLALCVHQSIKLENSIVAGPTPTKQPGPRPLRAPPPPDSRRGPLRQALYDMAKGEPDRAARNQMRRMIEERVEQELLADPDHIRPLAKPFMAICAELGLRVDVSKLSDEFLGMAPVNRGPPGSPTASSG